MSSHKHTPAPSRTHYSRCTVCRSPMRRVLRKGQGYHWRISHTIASAILAGPIWEYPS